MKAIPVNRNQFFYGITISCFIECAWNASVVVHHTAYDGKPSPLYGYCSFLQEKPPSLVDSTQERNIFKVDDFAKFKYSWHYLEFGNLR